MKQLKASLAFIMVFLFSGAVAQIKKPPLPPPPPPPAEIKMEKVITPEKRTNVELPVPPEPEAEKFTPPVIVTDETLPTPPKLIKKYKRSSMPLRNKFLPPPPPPTPPGND